MVFFLFSWGWLKPLLPDVDVCLGASRGSCVRPEPPDCTRVHVLECLSATITHTVIQSRNDALSSGCSSVIFPLIKRSPHWTLASAFSIGPWSYVWVFYTLFTLFFPEDTVLISDYFSHPSELFAALKMSAAPFFLLTSLLQVKHISLSALPPCTKMETLENFKLFPFKSRRKKARSKRFVWNFNSK